jgi:hypothetical protein
MPVDGVCGEELVARMLKRYASDLQVLFQTIKTHTKGPILWRDTTAVDEKKLDQQPPVFSEYLRNRFACSRNKNIEMLNAVARWM